LRRCAQWRFARPVGGISWLWNIGWGLGWVHFAFLISTTLEYDGGISFWNYMSEIAKPSMVVAKWPVFAFVPLQTGFTLADESSGTIPGCSSASSGIIVLQWYDVRCTLCLATENLATGDWRVPQRYDDAVEWATRYCSSSYCSVLMRRMPVASYRCMRKYKYSTPVHCIVHQQHSRFSWRVRHFFTELRHQCSIQKRLLGSD
jgi:hypothetical protein